MTRTGEVQVSAEEEINVLEDPREATAADVAVVITHYRALPDLLACLRALEGAEGGPFDVVVCDSAAQDDAGAAVRAYHPGVQYLGFADNVGYAALVNAGIAECKTEFVLVLNADVRVEPRTLLDLVEVARANPHVAVLAPKLVNPDGSVQDSAFAFHRPSTVLHRRTLTRKLAVGQRELERFTAPSRQVVQGQGEVVLCDWVLGAAMLVRREAAEEVGPLDHHYFLYFEDVDWCLRFWNIGLAVGVATGVQARHRHERASRGGPMNVVLNPLTRVHMRSAVRFFSKHGLRPVRLDIPVPEGVGAR